METVSPHYQDVLDHLAETLMADRRERFVALLQQTDTEAFIPRPATSSEVQLITVV